MTNQSMREFLNISAALSDENRVRALLALRAGELCLCQITELLQLAPSTVSKHLSLLRQAGLVEARKQGRWMFYRIADPSHAALQWCVCCIACDPQVSDDQRRLKAILKQDPEDLCKRQGERRKCCSSAPATRAARKWPKDGLARLRAIRSSRTRPEPSPRA